MDEQTVRFFKNMGYSNKDIEKMLRRNNPNVNPRQWGGSTSETKDL